MSAPYSLDLRERVLAAARDDHLSPGVTAARFRVANSTVRNWLRRARDTGGVAATPHGGGTPPKVDAAGAPVLERRVRRGRPRPPRSGPTAWCSSTRAAARPTWCARTAARRAAGAPAARYRPGIGG